MIAEMVVFAQNPPGAQPDIFATLAPLLVMMLVLWFLFIVPARRQRREQQQRIASLKKNDEVITTAGIIGHVVSIRPEMNELVLKTDDSGGRIRVLLSSVAHIVTPNSPPPDADKK